MLNRLFCTLGLSILIGCNGDQSTSPITNSAHVETAKPVADHATEPEVTLTPQERATLAKDALFNELSTQLLAAMSNGGPARAIEVCSKLAPKLAKEVGNQHQLLIGRTAVRLRNENNLPPKWSEPLLTDLPTTPIFRVLEDGRTGALFPIMLKVQCLTCHGPEEKIAPEIRSELARLYPSDKATGFQEGDLRGWFWVEVPADMENAGDHEGSVDSN